MGTYMTGSIESGETPSYQDTLRPTPTIADATRSAHNPKVAGSNPAPATREPLAMQGVPLFLGEGECCRTVSRTASRLAAMTGVGSASGVKGWIASPAA